MQTIEAADETQAWARGYVAGQQDAITIERRAAQHGCIPAGDMVAKPCEACVTGAEEAG